MSCIEAITDTFSDAAAKAVYKQSCDSILAKADQSAKFAICDQSLKSAAQLIKNDCSGEVTTADVVTKISGCEDVCHFASSTSSDAPSCKDALKDSLSSGTTPAAFTQSCQMAQNLPMEVNGQQVTADDVCNISATALVSHTVGNCTGEVTNADVFAEIEACKDICSAVSSNSAPSDDSTATSDDSTATSDSSSSAGSSESSCPYDEEFCGELKSFFGTVADCDGKVDLPDCKKAVMGVGASEDDAAETCSELLNAVGGDDKIIEYEEMMNFLKATKKPKADMKEVVDMVKKGFGGSWKECASSSSTPSILLAGLTAALIFLF